MQTVTMQSIAVKKLMGIAKELFNLEDAESKNKNYIAKQLSTEIILAISDLKEHEKGLSDFISTERLSKLSGYSTKALQSHRLNGIGFPYYKVNRKVFYRESEIVSILENHKVNVKKE